MPLEANHGVEDSYGISKGKARFTPRDILVGFLLPLGHTRFNLMLKIIWAIYMAVTLVSVHKSMEKNSFKDQNYYGIMLYDRLVRWQGKP
jgi:hypothetical protein